MPADTTFGVCARNVFMGGYGTMADAIASVAGEFPDSTPVVVSQFHARFVTPAGDEWTVTAAAVNDRPTPLFRVA